MDRLTTRREDGGVETKGQEWSNFEMCMVSSTRGNDRYDIRLAEYEDAGLTPEEVKALRDGAPGWISTTERLPEAVDGNYAGLILIFWDGWKMSTVTVQRMLQLQAEGGWNVTHWMPLPKPPELKVQDA